MKKIMLLCACAIVLAACGNNKTNDTKADHVDHDDHSHHNHETMDMGTPSDESVYNLETHWTDQKNEHVMLPMLGGKVQVLAMVYTSCPSVCPRLVADMQTIDSKLLPDQKAQVNFVLVSIDPMRDDPARLKKYAEENSLDESRWKLLNGSEGDVLELAALLGVKYKKISDVDYAHSNLITVLNQKGEIVYQQQGLGTDPERALESINNCFLKN